MSTSPVNAKKAQVGYVAATQRNRCGSCNNATENNRFWTCKKHGLMVTVYAVCNDWAAVVPRGFRPPESMKGSAA